MQDHISYTKEHMESLKALCDEQKPTPEIFVVVSNACVTMGSHVGGLSAFLVAKNNFV